MKIECFVCNKIFGSRKVIVKHLGSHEKFGSNIFPIQCLYTGCNGYKFGSLSGFNRHLRDFHKIDKLSKDSEMVISYDDQLEIDDNNLIFN
ncbi:unnamed protein product [Brachionus calyciflorus]|uniref:C2H2-type domain-containing protein n=1 Tax=Brachionus calyciflorus TaxID=104777 RepID=A0A814JI98_9BILA|nr:unnamed protein product [Brachionus calyciflorus]